MRSSLPEVLEASPEDAQDVEEIHEVPFVARSTICYDLRLRWSHPARPATRPA